MLMFNFAEWFKNDVLGSLIKKFLKEGLTFNIDTDFQVETPKNEQLIVIHVKGKVTVKTKTLKNRNKDN